ncbi:hypothetical protein psyc5s11_53550 [Clostridium gelidum]|uniref:Initiator Rep protein WH1 domain-containing protein n=1 Tax=Clostridium gelidum TaxID=704125 RepID=A0ABN6J631_9CLOT|nr:hypothetical protein psyc5s11_53550 [Clostridium gelidum]
MESTERKTKVSNYILKNMFANYTEIQIKFFMMVINKAVSAHYAKTTEENRDDIYNYASQEITMSLDFIKKYKGKKHMTKIEIMDTMESLHIVLRLINADGYLETLSAIEKITYEHDKEQFRIILTDEAMEYLILVSENYSCLDLEFLKDLRGKYEMGLYMIHCMYNELKQKSKYYTIEELQDFLNITSGGQTRDTLRYIDSAKEKLKDRGLKLDYEISKRGKKITDIVFRFRQKNHGNI